MLVKQTMKVIKIKKKTSLCLKKANLKTIVSPTGLVGP